MDRAESGHRAAPALLVRFREFDLRQVQPQHERYASTVAAILITARPCTRRREVDECPVTRQESRVGCMLMHAANPGAERGAFGAGRPRREQMTPVYRGVVKPTTDGLTPVKFTFFEKSG